jgi:hypothetical protein
VDFANISVFHLQRFFRRGRWMRNQIGASAGDLVSISRLSSEKTILQFHARMLLLLTAKGKSTNKGNTSNDPA